MILALDATYSTGAELSGVGVYSHEILFGLARGHPEARFRFCFRPHRFREAGRIQYPPNARRWLLWEPFGASGAALFHGLNQRLPTQKMKRTVTTFHDLFVMTGEYSTAEFRARFTEQARDAAARSDVIVAVSEFTRGQVISLLNAAPSKVRVVHHGVRPLAFPQIPREKVILSVGAIQTRKNIARLVEAFESVDADWRLVLAGSAGYGSEAIQARIAASPARDRIVVTGYLPAEELAGWYARASIFAFPSLDEGFGMPVLEAMAAGVPVVTSNRSAMPEVAGEAAILVDPEDTEALTEALRGLAKDEGARAEWASRGTTRAALFTWDKAVLETWNIYRELLG